MDLDLEMSSLLAERQLLARDLRSFGTAEAAMRLRALAEIAQNLETDALLNLAASSATPATVTPIRAKA